jgi:hypothetical protein
MLPSTKSRSFLTVQLLLLSAANEPKLKSEIRDLNEKLGKQEELIDEQSRKIEGLESEKSGLKAGEQGTLILREG